MENGRDRKQDGELDGNGAIGNVRCSGNELKMKMLWVSGNGAGRGRINVYFYRVTLYNQHWVTPGGFAEVLC